MTADKRETKLAMSRGIVNLQDQYLNSIKPARNQSRSEYSRSFSGGHGPIIFRYFTFESLFLLVCLTASLLILPLILPPLPPPPSMLLLLPIFILALLMVLAFMPSSNVRDATRKYV